MGSRKRERRREGEEGGKSTNKVSLYVLLSVSLIIYCQLSIEGKWLFRNSLLSTLSNTEPYMCSNTM